MRRQSSTDRLGRLAMLVVVAFVLILPLFSVSSAGTFTFPVQSEQAITGTTSGLGGAQTDDGILETLRESDTAPDSVTAPATQTLTTGTMVAGAFPGDIQTANDVFIQYREANVGSPTGDEIGAIGFKANTGVCATSLVNCPKQLDWTGSAWGTPETELATGIAVDNTSSGSVTGAVSSITVSHATGAGANRFMLVGVTVTNDGTGAAGNRVLDSVTYGGVGLTQVTTVSVVDDARVWIYRLINPASGTANVVATFDGNVASGGGIVMGVMTFTGVDQTTPLGTAVTEAEGDGSITVPAANDELIFDTISTEDATALSAGADQTQRWAFRPTAVVGGGGSTQLGSANDIMSWTTTGSTHRAQAGVPIKPASTAIENVRVIWDTATNSTLFWILMNTGANIHSYKCTNVDSCSKEDVDPSSGSDYAVTQTVGTAPERHWDAAIEASSGELLLLYDNPATVTNDFCYRTRTSGSGGTWSSETCFDNTAVASTNPSFGYVTLVNNPGSNRIGAGAFDTTNGDFILQVWDGTAWVNANKASSTAVTLAGGWGGTVLAEDASDEFVAYSGNGADSMAECEWTSSGGWEAACTAFDPNTASGNDLRIMSARPLDGTNKAMVCQGDDLADDTCWRWTGVSGTGGSRGTIQVLTTNDGSATTVDMRAGFDWNPDQSGTSDGLVVFYANTTGSLSYNTYNDATDGWGTAATFTSAGTHKWIDLLRTRSAGNTNKVFVVTSNSNFDILAYRWTGSGAPANEQTITADTVNEVYPYFGLAFQTNVASVNYRLEVKYDWSGVPAGDSYVLSVRGYRGDEDFNVQVLTPPSTWTTRITVNSLTNQLFSVGLTSPEYNGGGPQVRFVDGVQDGSVSDLFLDWVALTTVRVTYSIDIRQNVTGVITGSNPILVVKGNITAGGENFHIHVWNITSASWNLLLAAPFTATNAYHNSSLSVDHLSGGTVRVRFVDAASLDTSQWALGLDFVAVVITNDQPTLTNAGVSPASGTITTSFTFFVRYSDAESNVPAFVNLTLDGIPYAMIENNSADTNYVDGKDYFLVRVIGIRGTFNFSFSARASAGDLTLATTAVQQVSVLNRAPNISNPVASDAVHTGRSYVRDFNGTDPDDDSLVWSVSTNASWLSIGSANGTVWGVAPPDIRSFYANLSVSDGFGGVAWLNYTLSVGNLPPSITTVVANMVSARRASFSYDMNASDPNLDPLIWSLRSNASFLAMDPVNGTLSGIVSSVPSSYWIEVTVSDGLGGIDFRNFSLGVVNRPPAIFVSAPSTVEAGASYSGSFSGTDPDDDPLSWSLTTNATWLLIDAATGQLYGTPSLGTYFANLSGRDPYGGVAYQNFTITVQAQSTTPPDGPPGLRSELWTFPLIALLFGVLIAIVMPRRRPIIESAFLIDQTGRVRFEFAIPGTPYDEGRLQSTLRGVNWKGLGRVSDPPYTLHIKPDPSGDWIFVSRTSDTDRVTKSAEKLLSKMQGDVTSRKKPRLSERSS